MCQCSARVAARYPRRMNRRSFFAALAASTATAAFALDEERALWVPGQKLISLPSEIARPPRIADEFGRVWVMVAGQPVVHPTVLRHMLSCHYQTRPYGPGAQITIATAVCKGKTPQFASYRLVRC